jgi:hypothetical protein
MCAPAHGRYLDASPSLAVRLNELIYQGLSRGRQMDSLILVNIGFHGGRFFRGSRVSYS